MFNTMGCRIAEVKEKGAPPDAGESALPTCCREGGARSAAAPSWGRLAPACLIHMPWCGPLILYPPRRLCGGGADPRDARGRQQAAHHTLRVFTGGAPRGGELLRVLWRVRGVARGQAATGVNALAACVCSRSTGPGPAPGFCATLRLFPSACGLAQGKRRWQIKEEGAVRGGDPIRLSCFNTQHPCPLRPGRCPRTNPRNHRTRPAVNARSTHGQRTVNACARHDAPSAQVGCAMACQFCLTGKLGLAANLSAAQIVEQLVEARRLQVRLKW